jgi:hypothetical protein
MPSLHTPLRFGRPVEDLSASDIAAITFEEALEIAESGEHRWHCPDIDQE